VCWRDYSKTLGEAVQKTKNWGQADLSDKTRGERPVTVSAQLHQDRFQDVVDLVISSKNNYAALKINDAGIFPFFYFIKISFFFPVHFLFLVEAKLIGPPSYYDSRSYKRQTFTC